MMLRVDFNELNAMANGYINNTNAVYDLVKRLEQQVSELVSGGAGVWQGAAAAKYEEAQQGWNAALQHLQNAALGVADAIKQTNVIFANAEADNMARIQRTGGVLSA